MRQLIHFDIAEREEDFLLRLEADDGETLEFAVEPEQMEVLIDRLNDVLEDDEDEDEDEDGSVRAETYQKPLG